jgi:Mg-chelatase subunit ChlD
MISSQNRTPFLRELQSLASQITGEEIILVEGEQGCHWSWNWRDRVITVAPEFLIEKSADVCRAILLHESAHCAITRIHHLLPASSWRLHQDLLNVLEDLRIEDWLAKTFPGCAAWLHAANRIILSAVAGQAWPRSLQIQFLRALMETAHTGCIPEGPDKAVLEALAEVREAVDKQTACHPDSSAGRAAARETINAQQRMLAIFGAQIRPVWERLVAIDETQGRQRITTCIESDGVNVNGVMNDRIGRARRSKLGARAETPFRRSSAQGAEYLTRQRKLASRIDRLAQEFLALFATHSRDSMQDMRSSGERLNLRVAMQSQADPRLHDRIWSRRRHHSRFDPLVVLVLDCSGSMEGEKFDAAFDGIVLLSEVCLRVGLPMALWTFNNEARHILRPHGQCDSPARRAAIDRLRSECGGGTAMDEALSRVHSSPEIHQFEHPLVFVLGDGCPSDSSATLAQIAKFEASGIPLLGLGIGPDTRDMATLFKNYVVGMNIDAVSSTLCSVLRKTLHKMISNAVPRRAA